MESTIKQRLIEYLSYRNIGQNKFEKMAGISNGYISNIKSNIGSSILAKIFNVSKDLNPDWLLYGEGSMLKPPPDGVPTARHANVVNGRLEYIRAKTHKLYSIKIEPEAAELLEKYKGKNYLLFVSDNCSNYKNYLHRLGEALKSIGPVKRVGRGGKKVREPLFPNISQYWCRHSWATIAASLDIPKETIAAGLGHGGNTVTDIYIDFDRRKVDEANRRIIDWVMYGKK